MRLDLLFFGIELGSGLCYCVGGESKRRAPCAPYAPYGCATRGVLHEDLRSRVGRVTLTGCCARRPSPNEEEICYGNIDWENTFYRKEVFDR